MSNLDDAFLKAYAKHQSVRNSSERANVAADGPRNVASPKMISPAMASNVSSRESQKPSESNGNTSVVASRVTGRSVVNRTATPRSTSSVLDVAGEKRYRVDEVLGDEFAPAVQKSSNSPKAKPSSRKPLSEYLAEMRAQIEAIDTGYQGDASVDSVNPTSEDVITPQIVKGLAESLKSEPVTSSPIYTYPESKKPVTTRIDEQNVALKNRLADKVELRKLASASIASPQNTSTVTSEDSVSATKETVKSRIWPNQALPVSKHPANDSSDSVRDRWRKEDVTYRLDVGNNPFAIYQSPATTKGNDSSTSADGTDDDFFEDHFHTASDSETDLIGDESLDDELLDNEVRDGYSAASIEVVKSLSEFATDTNRSPLYERLKSETPQQKSRIEREIKKAAKAIVNPFNAEWEVDEFQWPFTVLDLIETQESAFDEISNHLESANRKGLKVLALTSAERGVGKSTVSLSLAASMANKGLNVALIDGDLENPSLSTQLNLDVSIGWNGCIDENVPLESVAVKSLAEKVTFFPLLEAMSVRDLESNQIKINHVLRRISRSFDLVIVDCQRLNRSTPRILGTGDESVVDAALVIVDSELTVRERVEVTLELLEEQGLSSIGIIENFANLRGASLKAS